MRCRATHACRVSRDAHQLVVVERDRAELRVRYGCAVLCCAVLWWQWLRGAELAHRSLGTGCPSLTRLHSRPCK